jgi:hypothetical protein
MTKPAPDVAQLSIRYARALDAIDALRTALDSLNTYPNSEAAMLLRHIDARFHEFVPVTENQKPLDS